MVAIPERSDPTLRAIDEILETQTNNQPPRNYIGASGIGDCARKIWYRFHTEERETFDAPTIRRFNDGHRVEDVMAAHLRMVPGVTLWTHDTEGKQFGFTDGPFAGNYDGVILGLLQAPTTPHLWECKATDEKKFNEFIKLRAEDEKTALQKWNPIYYAQAVIYMHKAELTRHYLTVCTPGMRNYTSCRTEANPVYATALIEKAKRIAVSKTPPERIGGPDWYACKWCGFYEICHKGAPFKLKAGVNTHA